MGCFIYIIYNIDMKREYINLDTGDIKKFNKNPGLPWLIIKELKVSRDKKGRLTAKLNLDRIATIEILPVDNKV